MHVFLQTEITKLGYKAKKNEDKLQELVENNNILNYNIYALESPGSLDSHVVLNDYNLKILKPVQVFGLYPEYRAEHSIKDKNSSSLSRTPVFVVLRRFFTGKQAEARQ